MPELLNRITPDQFDKLIAYDQIEPLGPMPGYRLLVYIAAILINKDREGEDVITLKEIAEFAGLPKEEFESPAENKFTSPEVASAIFRR